MKLFWPFGKSGEPVAGAAGSETKAAWPLVALSEPRSARWGSREAGALTRDGYLKNAVVYRCVRMVAEAAASIALRTAHEPLANLIRKRGPEESAASFLEDLYTELLLTGNGFAEAVRLPGETAIAGLCPVWTAAVRPNKDARGWVEAWAVRGQGGRVSAAAEAGARLVLLDEAVARASVSELETGVALLWPAAGLGEAAEAAFENRAGLPWSPAQLPAPAGQVRWARRGRDVPESWDLPDPAGAVTYVIEADYGAGFTGRAETILAEAGWPGGALALRIAETGPDGRTGEWLSIPAGSPYL